MLGMFERVIQKHGIDIKSLDVLKGARLKNA